MARIVVLFQSQALAVQRSIDLVALVAQALEVGVVFAPAVGDRLGEVVAQQSQAVGSEQSAGHELDERVDDALLLDLQRCGMAGHRGGDDAAVGLKAAAIPVGVALVGALHPPPAQRAAHASAQHVQATITTAPALRIRRRRVLDLDLVASRAVLDGVKELLGDKGLVHRHRAPDPLLARALERAAWSLVVAAPHVVAGVLGVSQHRLQLRATPGLAQRHLVLAVAFRRRVAVQVGVELVADLPESQPVQAVVLEGRQDDRRADGIGHEPVLLLALTRFVRIGVLVGLQHVPVWHRAAGVPALAHGFLHPAAALLDQVAHVPLRDALLDAPREDRGRAGAHRLVGREQRDVEQLEVSLDPRSVGGHPRQPIDRLDDHRVKRTAIGRRAQQLAEAAVAWHRDAEAGGVGAVAALREVLAA